MQVFITSATDPIDRGQDSGIAPAALTAPRAFDRRGPEPLSRFQHVRHSSARSRAGEAFGAA